MASSASLRKFSYRRPCHSIFGPLWARDAGALSPRRPSSCVRFRNSVTACSSGDAFLPGGFGAAAVVPPASAAAPAHTNTGSRRSTGTSFSIKIPVYRALFSADVAGPAFVNGSARFSPVRLLVSRYHPVSHRHFRCISPLVRDDRLPAFEKPAGEHGHVLPGLDETTCTQGHFAGARGFGEEVGDSLREFVGPVGKAAILAVDPGQAFGADPR